MIPAGDYPSLRLATIATETPMGAQIYQERIAERAESALLLESAREWSVRRAIVRSMRSDLPGNRRLPMHAIATASPSVRRQVGRLLFRGDAVTHRMNLELPPGPAADVITIHDVVAWRFDDESPPVPAGAEEARRAAAVICVSEFSANEAIDLLGIRSPHVVHNGVDDAFFDAPAIEEPTRRELGIGDQYVLHSGGAARRKNLDALAEAWPLVRRSRPGLQLVLSGPVHPRRTALFEALPGAVLLGRVPEHLVPRLVAGAQAVVVPSLYEGFGLPVLEAMAANTPVVAARTSSLPEIVGAAGLLVEPTGRGIADGLLAATSGDSEISWLIRAGRERAAEFTWDLAAQGHARVWDAVG